MNTHPTQNIERAYFLNLKWFRWKIKKKFQNVPETRLFFKLLKSKNVFIPKHLLKNFQICFRDIYLKHKNCLKMLKNLSEYAWYILKDWDSINRSVYLFSHTSIYGLINELFSRNEKWIKKKTNLAVFIFYRIFLYYLIILFFCLNYHIFIYLIIFLKTENSEYFGFFSLMRKRNLIALK